MVASGEHGFELGSGRAHGGDDHCGEHCPFLNRSDYRCSDKLRLDHIDHAFDYCFGDYKACPVYLEQLAERRVRRVCGLLTSQEPVSNQTNPDAIRPARRPLVQLTLGAARAQPHRYPQRAA